jgi:hypothetical protein
MKCYINNSVCLLSCIRNVSSHDGEEADDTGKGFIVAIERDFKRWTRPPKDHFEKLLEVTYLHLSYLVKDKL